MSIKITVEKMFPSGALRLSSIVDGQLIQRVYYGYSVKEAKVVFLEEIKEKTETHK